MSGPAISGLSVLTPSVPRWQVAMADFDLSGTYSDWFGYKVGVDPIVVNATVTGPRGETYFQPVSPWQEYVVTGHTSGHGETKTTSGSLHWRFHFAPTYEGVWTATVTATTPSGATTSSSFSWTCTTQVSPLSAWQIRYGNFTYSDGTWFAPIGHNYGFNDRDYTLDLTAGANDFMDRMGATGQNTTRVWMHPHYRTEIDQWTSGAAMYGGFDNDYSGIRGDINLRALWDMAYLLDRAGQNNVSAILVMQAHGAFSTISDALWTENPYNSANGGLISSPELLFSNSAMLEFQKRKYRIAQAALFIYPAVGLIEYGNEMGSIGTSSTNAYSSTTTLSNWNSFLTQIGQWRRSIDYLNHKATVSQIWEPNSWTLTPGTITHFDTIMENTEVHVPQFHRYHWSDEDTNGDRGTERQIALWAIGQYGKPVLQGEAGAYRSPTVPEAQFDPTTSSLGDENISHLLEGTHAHNSAWESLMTPGCRWGGLWWWGSYLRDNSSQNRSSGTAHGVAWSFPLDEIIYPPLVAFATTPTNLTAVVGDTTISLAWEAEDPSMWSPRASDLTIDTPTSMIGYGFSNSVRGWFWIRDELNRYNSGVLPGDMAGRTVSGDVILHGFSDGTYEIEVWDTHAGTITSVIIASSVSGSLTFTTPTIDRDAAFKIHSTTLVTAPPPPPPPAPPPIVPGPVLNPPRVGGPGSPVPAGVTIAYDGQDITRYVLFADASFESAIQATPGAFAITIKDRYRNLGPFVTGKEVTLDIDGIRMYGGYVLNVVKKFFFDVVDTRDLTKVTRMWVLTGMDYNYQLDKRVLRNPTTLTAQAPNIAAGTYDGSIIRSFFPVYFDLDPDFDLVTLVQDIHLFDLPWAWQTPGSTMRSQLDDLAQFGAFYFYDPYKRLHYEPVQALIPSWGFSDVPSAPLIAGVDQWIGYREGSTTEDATGQVDDALIWGGTAFSNNGVGGIVFARKQDAATITAHRRWQLSELHPGDSHFASQAQVQARANAIITGASDATVIGNGIGMLLPEKQYALAWFGHDVPKDAFGVPMHLQAGAVTTLQLWTFSEDGGTTPFTLSLPLKTIKISFPTLQDGTGVPYVRFDGFFGIQQTDPNWLWNFLLKQAQRSGQQISTVTIATTTSVDAPPSGTFYSGAAVESPDGTRTVFHFPYPYLPGTVTVYLNGLIQRPGTDFTETTPSTGTFTMSSAPVSADSMLVQCRTA